ncbi:MAG: hypothetical protein AAGB51_11015 [Planctomycetota bacterium]
MRQLLIGTAGAALAGIGASFAFGQPTVPAGLQARLIAPLPDGLKPQIEAIDDPNYGTGLLSAVGSGGVITVRLIRNSGAIEVIGTVIEPSPGASFGSNGVLIDPLGDYGGLLHVMYQAGPTAGNRSVLATLTPNGVSSVVYQSSPNNQNLKFTFFEGAPGSARGIVLLDGDAGGGTRLDYLDASYQLIPRSPNSVPPGRTDTDVARIRADVTGLYGSGLLFTDFDNNDALTGIYTLTDIDSGGTYGNLVGPIPWTQKGYNGLDLVAAGALGGRVFATDFIADVIEEIDPNGTVSVWASGFQGLGQISLAPDGESMYAVDDLGIWLIGPAGDQPGPVVLTTDPSTPAGSRLTGNPVAALRILFDEPVTFTTNDIMITDADGQIIGFDATGSGTNFMLLGLATPLDSNTCTVIIADTVISVATGAQLDGDDDGNAGGDVSLRFTHHCPADVTTTGATLPRQTGFGEPDSTIDLDDLGYFLGFWLAGCP